MDMEMSNMNIAGPSKRKGQSALCQSRLTRSIRKGIYRRQGVGLREAQA